MRAPARNRAGSRSTSGPPPGSGPAIVPVTAPDGARSEARLFVPDGAPRAVAVCLPAMGVEAGYYDPLGSALAELGLAALVAELRGNGTSSLRARRGVDFGYRELVELDVASAVSAARERFPGAPIYLLGHSLGGQVSVLFAAMCPGRVDGVAIVAAGTPYFRAYAGGHRATILAASIVFPALGAILGYLPGRAVGFGGREARRLIAEWGRSIRTGRFAFAGEPPDLRAAMAAVTLPVLAVSLEEDVLAPRGATDHLAGMLPRAALTRRHTARGELGDGIDHFRWVRRPAPVARIVADWIDASRGGAA
jgi:predicted alpha/beta hydrolase